MSAQLCLLADRMARATNSVGVIRQLSSDFPTGFGPEPQTPLSAEGPRIKTIVLGLIVLIGMAGGYRLFAGRREKLAHLSALESRITLAIDDQESLAEVSREGEPEIYYRVVLGDVPLGGWLSLACEWINPDGRVARRNHYRTRFIYKSTWPTYCRQRFGSTSPAGRWQVRMLMGDRALSTSAFVLQ